MPDSRRHERAYISQTIRSVLTARQSAEDIRSQRSHQPPAPLGIARVLSDQKSIDVLLRRAYRDLSRTLHGIGTHPDKATLLNSTHQSLHEFVANLKGATSRDDFDARHDAWCLERMAFFKTHPHSHKGKKFTFTYGQAQKWINMTLKYLAVLEHPSVRHVYPHLHVPIDSIVYEESEGPSTDIEVPRPPAETSWSRLCRGLSMPPSRQHRRQQRRLAHTAGLGGPGMDSPPPPLKVNFLKMTSPHVGGGVSEAHQGGVQINR